MKPASRGSSLAKLTADVGRLQEDVIRLYAWREVRQRLVQVFEGNPLLRDDWTPLHTFIFSGYTAQACLSVRRLMDRGKKGREQRRQPVSLGNVMKQLCDCPCIITRCDYVDRCRGAITKANCPDALSQEERGALDAAVERHIVEQANREYDAYSGPGRCRLSRYIIARHYCEARRKCDAVLKDADKRLAHCDRKGPGVPTWGELDDAIDAVGELFCYIDRLVTGSTSVPDELAGTWQGGRRDWEELLRIPWVSAASGQSVQAKPSPGSHGT